MSTSNPFAPKVVAPTKKVSEAEVVNPEPEVRGLEVPAGTISEVKAWVGDDKDRAQVALDAENAGDDPRKTLVEYLEGILGLDD